MKQEKLNQKIFQVLSYLIKKEIQPKNSVAFFREIDCSVIEKIRLQYSMLEKQKPSYTAFIIKAFSQAITEHPFVNARIFPSFPYNKIHKFKEVNAAVACEKNIPGAECFAFIDVIKNTDKKTIDQINRELTSLANSTVENNAQLKSFMGIIKNCPVFLARQLCTLPTLFPSLWEKYRGSSIIISSPAKYGVDCVAGTWAHPLGVSFGLVKRRPIVKKNSLVIAPTFTLSFAFDRRIIAGGPSARFFNSFANYLMDEEFLAKNTEEFFSNLKLPIEKIKAIA